MKNINIKKEIFDLCDASVEFWVRFKEEINAVPDDDEAELVLKWENFFAEHPEMFTKLTGTKLHIEQITKDLIMQGALCIKE